MRTALLFVFLSITCCPAFSQEASENLFKKNSVFAELGGQSPFYSINYERLFRQGAKLNYSFRVGFSIMPDDLSFPVGVTAVTGKNRHHAQFSLGITPSIQNYRTFLYKNDRSDKVIYIAPGFGYRYQKPQGKLFFSAGASPLFLLDPPSGQPLNFSVEFRPSGYVAGGWNF